MTGVPVMPTSVGISVQFRSALLLTVLPPVGIRLFFQYSVPESASMAKTLSCSVATYSTLCVPPPMPTFARYRGCAYTVPSTMVVNNFPNFVLLTLAGVRMVSCTFWPVRELSLW